MLVLFSTIATCLETECEPKIEKSPLLFFCEKFTRLPAMAGDEEQKHGMAIIVQLAWPFFSQWIFFNCQCLQLVEWQVLGESKADPTKLTIPMSLVYTGNNEAPVLLKTKED